MTEEQNQKYVQLIKNVQDQDYLTFRENVGEIFKEKLDVYYENRTKELYNEVE